ncbi:MAG: hypothetical protein HY208_07000 [Nitrospirae bacterium]|nr:hypothetical protein [Nitrospirota bacterium]
MTVAEKLGGPIPKQGVCGGGRIGFIIEKEILNLGCERDDEIGIRAGIDDDVRDADRHGGVVSGISGKVRHVNLVGSAGVFAGGPRAAATAVGGVDPPQVTTAGAERCGIGVRLRRHGHVAVTDQLVMGRDGRAVGGERFDIILKIGPQPADMGGGGISDLDRRFIKNDLQLERVIGADAQIIIIVGGNRDLGGAVIQSNEECIVGIAFIENREADARAGQCGALNGHGEAGRRQFVVVPAVTAAVAVVAGRILRAGGELRLQRHLAALAATGHERHGRQQEDGPEPGGEFTRT